MNDALSISGLTKTYKDFTLDNVSFSVPCGSIVGLVGENGAGKSTTINAAFGLVQKESGSVAVLGKEELDNKTKERGPKLREPFLLFWQNNAIKLITKYQQ